MVLKEWLEKVRDKLFGSSSFGEVVGYMFLGITLLALCILCLMVMACVILAIGFWMPIVLIVLYGCYRLGKYIVRDV